MQAGSVAVRRAKASDASQLVRWQCEMAWETEARRLDPSVVMVGVGRALEDSAKGRYYVAEGPSGSQGGLMLTTEWSDWRASWFWWIQSVYVQPAARGRGVFRALYEHVRGDALRDPDVCGLRLYVERDNARARSIYGAIGMQETHYRLFEVELR